MLYEKTEAQDGDSKLPRASEPPRVKLPSDQFGLKAKAVASTLCRTNSAVHYYGMLVCKISSNP